MSIKQSYTIRFRVFVEDLSRKHEIMDTGMKSKKRTYEDSFGDRDYEVERYGQEIVADFFRYNIGHTTIG